MNNALLRAIEGPPGGRTSLSAVMRKTAAQQDGATANKITKGGNP